MSRVAKPPKAPAPMTTHVWWVSKSNKTVLTRNFKTILTPPVGDVSFQVFSHEKRRYIYFYKTVRFRTLGALLGFRIKVS